MTVRDPDDADRKAIIRLTGVFRAPGTKQITVRLSRLDADLLEAIGPRLRDRPAEDAAKGSARADLLRTAEAGPLNEVAWHRDCSRPWRRAP